MCIRDRVGVEASKKKAIEGKKADSLDAEVDQEVEANIDVIMAGGTPGIDTAKQAMLASAAAKHIAEEVARILAAWREKSLRL